MQNSTGIKQKHMKNNRNSKRNNRYILIDLSAYNVRSIANVILGYTIFAIASKYGLGFESSIAMTAFKYVMKIDM